MNISEMLVDRRSESTDESKVDKSLGYVPFNVYSFGELDKVEQVYEMNQSYHKVLNKFMQIADNIMYDKPDDFENKLYKLAQEFQSRLTEIQLNKGQMIKSGSMTLYKAANGQLQWVGVPTNKFEDREQDIFSDYAHRNFVKGVREGKYPYPDLYPWHTGTVGKSTWIDYDERGFVVAGGYILPEYEQFVLNLVTKTTEPMGMSHGMFVKDIVRDATGVIISYKSFEFSFLPQSKAANLLTSFSTS